MFKVSYPTHAADFLTQFQDARKEPHQTNGVNGHATEPFSVIVIGAGLGGLAAAISIACAGHKVTVLEAAAKIDEVGAGINITPNSARLLLRWGFEKTIDGRTVEPEQSAFHRWKDGSMIGKTALVPEFRSWFNAPYYVVHRAHFLDAMYKLAVSCGVKVQANSAVVDIDFDTPSVTLRDGRAFQADLIIGADGIKSNIRNQMLRHLPALQETGFAAYRATVPVRKMIHDRELAQVVSTSSLDIWIGPGRHVAGYMIAGGSTYNLVLSHPETTDPETWDQSTALEEMHQQFDGWDPVVTKILGLITSSRKWPLRTLPELPAWVSSSGKVAIMGNAAHPMLPYMSQGAAMAVEDAAVLGKCLQKIPNASQIPDALRIYERLRKPRASQVQEASRMNGIIWHFEDGEYQEARDRGSRVEVEGRHFVTSTNQWSDPTTQLWLYAYDAEEEVERTWSDLYKEIAWKNEQK